MVRVSVAISTYQRAHRLPALIGALEQQTLPLDQYEVVIADNGSTDDTHSVLADLAESTPLTLRVVRLGVNRGPAEGRNAAWRGALAPIVAFTDDDCLPQPEWLEHLLAAMDGDRAVVVGRTVPPAEDAELVGAPFVRVVRVDEARYFPTCNVAYRRDDIEEVGGFDANFDEPAGEDTDLALRVLAAGAEGRFAPDAVVHHPVRPPSFSATARETLRWTNIPAVIARHPSERGNLLHRGIFWKASHPLALLAALGLLLGVRWRAAVILVVPWVRFRTRIAPGCAGSRRRWVILPGVLFIDLLEVAVMVRGSARARTLVL